MTKTINFVSQGNASLASHRMRVMKPAELINIGVEGLEAVVSKEPDRTADVVVFNKHFNQKENLKAARSLKIPTVFDVCDDHFDRDNGFYYKEMCKSVTGIVCNTDAMKDRILKVTGRTARVIKDPVTFPEVAPKTPETSPAPQCLWYGHVTNAVALIPWLDHSPVQVTTVANKHISHPKAVFYNWKPMLVEKLVQTSNIVLVPTADSSEQPWIKCKSPNRVVDALHAGQFVITNNEDLYDEFQDYVHLIKSPEELTGAIEWFMGNREEAAEKILKGQAYVKNHYHDENILDRWLGELKELEIIKSWKK